MRSERCNLDRMLYINVSRLEFIHLNDLSLSSNFDLEGFRASLNDLKGAFIGALEGCTMRVPLDKDKFGLL